MSDWTIEALKVHIDTGLRNIEGILHEQDRRYEQSFQAMRDTQRIASSRAEVALTKAENSMDNRIVALNEIRGSLNDVINTMMPRVEVTATLKTMSDKIDELKSRLDSLQGAAKGLYLGWGWLVGAVALAATIVTTWVVVG